MLNAYALILLGTAGLLYFLRLRGTGRFSDTSAEERNLIERAGAGDEEAARELGRRTEQEQAALRLKAASNPRIAGQYLAVKERELQALQWAESALDAKAAAAGYSAEKTAEVRARLEGMLREVERDIVWAKERATP
jgi:hypothetical protein